MKASIALAKETEAKKNFTLTKSEKGIYRTVNEPERQLYSLRRVIAHIRHDGDTPLAESIATNVYEQYALWRACSCAACTSADAWQPVCAAGGFRDSGEACGRAAGGQI